MWEQPSWMTWHRVSLLGVNIEIDLVGASGRLKKKPSAQWSAAIVVP